MVSTLDEKYIIIFGGWNEDMYMYGVDDSILVYDLEQNIILKSNIKCPLKGEIKAVSLASNGNELAVYGFLRREYEKEEMKEVRNLPDGIIQLMVQWYSISDVHL